LDFAPSIMIFIEETLTIMSNMRRCTGQWQNCAALRASRACAVARGVGRLWRRWVGSCFKVRCSKRPLGLAVGWSACTWACIFNPCCYNDQFPILFYSFNSGHLKLQNSSNSSILECRSHAIWINCGVGF
jgi:hypothetical protein